MVSVVAISGVSGSGKSTALKALEDIGYFCVDNMPPVLLPQFLILAAKAGDEIKAVATVIDVRSGEFLADATAVFEQIKAMGHPLHLIFLDTDTEILLKRYKETRRRHPLREETTVRNAVAREREQIGELRNSADVVLETSELTVHDLKREIWKRFGLQTSDTSLTLAFLSFAFKRGLPLDADIVFDVRFMQNPYFVPELREKTGRDRAVSDYVLNQPEAIEFLRQIESLLLFLLPYYRREGKAYLTVAIGCTGGQHRSVAIAEKLSAIFSGRVDSTSIYHRELGD